MLQVTPLRAFADNYIWLIHAPLDPGKVVVVDPGDAAPVRKALEDEGLDLAAILITHHHGDHVGGVDELVDEHTVAVFGPAGERIPGSPVPLREGEQAALPELGLAFDVLDVPGHTAGHIAYAGHGAVFCGDTLFSAGCGRLFEGTAEQMTSSLRKLKALSDDTRVYCAHEYTVGNLRFAQAVEPQNSNIADHLRHCEARRAQNEPTLPSTVGLERAINPFLRCDRQTVRQAAEMRAGHGLQSEAEVLAVVRDWKNGFKG